MAFNYEFGEDEGYTGPTTSPGNYDWDKENPTGLWENNCNAQ
jgi:hypothetical protein